MTELLEIAAARDDAERRLTGLEVKLSFTEDALDQLDRIVTAQQNQIDRLTRELLALRLQMTQDAPQGPRNLRDELPPHY